MKIFETLLVASALMSLNPLCAEEAASQGKSAAEIAKDLANPNSPLASLNFKNQFRWFEGTLPGADNEFGYTMVAQPVFPFLLDSGDQLIFRPALPVIGEQPVYNPFKRDFESESGLGDLAFDLIYAPKADNGMLYGLGLISTLPTATNDLGLKQWTLGPEFLIGKITDEYVVGLFPSHQWDIAGWGDNQVNLTSIQLFGTLLPGDGWSIGTSPIITYDWTSDQWTIPLNLNIGKTVIWNGTPWKLSAEVNYYVEKSDVFASDWMVGINFTPVVDNFLANIFK